MRSNLLRNATTLTLLGSVFGGRLFEDRAIRHAIMPPRRPEEAKDPGRVHDVPSVEQKQGATNVSRAPNARCDLSSGRQIHDADGQDHDGPERQVAPGVEDVEVVEREQDADADDGQSVSTERSARSRRLFGGFGIIGGLVPRLGTLQERDEAAINAGRHHGPQSERPATIRARR
jgi:hypothetical protein